MGRWVLLSLQVLVCLTECSQCGCAKVACHAKTPSVSILSCLCCVGSSGSILQWLSNKQVQAAMQPHYGSSTQMLPHIVYCAERHCCGRLICMFMGALLGSDREERGLCNGKGASCRIGLIAAANIAHVQKPSPH